MKRHKKVMIRIQMLLTFGEPGGGGVQICTPLGFLEYLRDPHEFKNALSPIPRGTNLASDGIKIWKKYQPDIT